MTYPVLYRLAVSPCAALLLTATAIVPGVASDPTRTPPPLPSDPALAQEVLDELTSRVEATAKPAPNVIDPEWAFHPPVRPGIPADPSGWATSPIDAFIAEALRDRGLTPSPEADRRTLIRRLYFDVVGLPPTPEEIGAFVSDPSPAAYDRLVDAVLASPHYGERWTRHWLDIVRFAETNGFETNTPRNNAWPYRDYVIRAFNEDRPYPQFIREQLAGDALGEQAATGFLVAGPWDEVKSPDVELTKNQRDAELHDMVSVTSAAFLGLTAGCAKCHDHKFDPISQRDYYAMRALFAGVMHGERDLPVADEEDRTRKAEAVRAELNGVRNRLVRYIALADTSGSLDDAGLLTDEGPRPTRLRPAVSGMENIDRFPPVEAKFVRLTVLKTTELSPCIDEIELFGPGPDGANLALASTGAVASASSEYASNSIHQIAHLNDGEYGNSRSWIPTEGAMGWATIELPAPRTLERVVWARDRNGAFGDRIATVYRIEVSLDGNAWQTVATSWDRAQRGGELKGLLYDASLLASPEGEELDRLQKQRVALSKKLDELTKRPRVYAGAFEQPGPTHLLSRGDPMQEQEAVTPGGIGRVAPAFALGDATPEQERRIRLADWLTDPANPLADRVMVNRIWQHHFGRGLVDTPSDFGKMGARPTHPQLLDWLATEFAALGRRPKALHRLILLSATYRQSSTPREEALAVDADARLLWRFPPRRLEAEPIRDAILAVSGALDPAMGGPGYSVFEPNDNYVRVYIPKQEFGPAEWRRMVYQTKPRVQQDAVFGVFDCPDGAQSAPRRAASTTPLQALNLLNSPFIIQQSELFAERLHKDAGDSTSAQVRRAFQLALGRDPDEQERAASRWFVEQYGLPAFCRTIYNLNEFVFVE